MKELYKDIFTLVMLFITFSATVFVVGAFQPSGEAAPTQVSRVHQS